MQNMLLFAHSIVNMNCFALPLGSAKTAIVDATDVGVAAAEIAMRDDLQKMNMTFGLTIIIIHRSGSAIVRISW